ncbi:MAG: NAD-dependent epimerase/dehydratase family protein [Burkholderiaceae bacterium]
MLVKQHYLQNLGGKPATIAVTGGSGFIGQALTNRLIAEGFRPRLLTRSPKSRGLQNASYIFGDLVTGGPALLELLEGCDVLFHCAGEWQNPKAMRALHVDGTRNLLDAAATVGTYTSTKIHWVQLSSVGAYGPCTSGASIERTVTEETPLNPVGIYEKTKTEADALVSAAATSAAVSHSVLRPSNVFGPGMRNESLRSLIHTVKARRFAFIGRPQSIATYIHVDDVVECLMRCAFDPRAKGQVFNLSNDCLMEDLIQSISQFTGVMPPRLRIPEALARACAFAGRGIKSFPLTRGRIDALVNRTSYPTEKLERLLGFSPIKSLPGSIMDVFQASNQKTSVMD